MRTYVYGYVTCRLPDVVKTLNDYGAKGWRVVCRLDDGGPEVRFLIERSEEPQFLRPSRGTPIPAVVAITPEEAQQAALRVGADYSHNRQVDVVARPGVEFNPNHLGPREQKFEPERG